jgi:exodeoxyribonuclease VII large subunit
VASLTAMTLPLWAPEGEGRRSPPRQVSLVRLAGEIARAAAGVGRVAVEGEIHRPSTSRGRWVFFTLRDRAAEIRVAVPRAAAARCPMMDGERACVVGSLEWLNDRGALQLRAEEVTPVGEGAIAAMVAEARRRLTADGLTGRPRRRLPRLPRRVGVVCGADAAVRRDIESVAAQRFPGYPLEVMECAVSGPGAALAITDALADLAARDGVDVVILARGGGDATALLPWSDEGLCRAVAACPVPVVSAIGHDSDRPLCDEVADLRCGTPSIAAAAVIPDRHVLEAELDATLAGAASRLAVVAGQAGHRLAAVDTGGALSQSMRRAGDRLSFAHRQLAQIHPRHRVLREAARLAAVDYRLAMGQRLGAATGRLAAEGRHLAALSPHSVLQRGYALARDDAGAVIRRSDQVSVGGAITVELAAGTLVASVTEVCP